MKAKLDGRDPDSNYRLTVSEQVNLYYALCIFYKGHLYCVNIGGGGGGGTRLFYIMPALAIYRYRPSEH